MTLYDLVNKMENIKRFHATRTNRQHNLSAHTLRIIALSDMLAPESLSGLDRYSLMMIALMHDAEEVFIGDISYPMKKYIPEYEEIAWKAVHDNVDYKYAKFHQCNAPHLNNIVKVADLIDTPLQAIQEVNSGNLYAVKYFDKFLSKYTKQEIDFSILSKEGTELLCDTYYTILRLLAKHKIPIDQVAHEGII